MSLAELESSGDSCARQRGRSPSAARRSFHMGRGAVHLSPSRAIALVSGAYFSPARFSVVRAEPASWRLRRYGNRDDLCDAGRDPRELDRNGDRLAGVPLRSGAFWHSTVSRVFGWNRADAYSGRPLPCGVRTTTSICSPPQARRNFLLSKSFALGNPGRR